MNKTDAIRLFRQQGYTALEDDNTTFASQNSGINQYWANPKIDLLNNDWWLILNDKDNSRVTLFHVPAHTITNRVLMKGNDPEHMDIRIIYDDNDFTDSRSNIPFAQWLVHSFAYQGTTMLIENGILKSYNGDMKNVVIPEGVRVIAGVVEKSDSAKHLQGVKTDGVFYFPFNACDSIETVTMPDSVEEIGPKAFEHCKNLRSVKFSKNLKKIGPSAFLGCEKFTDITIPASITTIEQYAFDLIDIPDIKFEGTLEQWDKVEVNEEAFKDYPVAKCSDGDLEVIV